jgi:cellulose synthase/poly-beta-1,6-N-acetylglucosamine synthase-like glycosyltransferase
VEGGILKISIGICAYNEVRNIGNVLSNLLSQPLLPHQELLEIIVVCSGCTDGTDDVVKDFQEKDARVKLVNQISRQGKARAQNNILKEAKGDVIVFLSADTYPAKGSLANLVEAIRGNIGCVGGKVLPLNESRGLANFISRFTWKLHNHAIMYENKRGQLAHLAGDMFAVKQGAITQIPPHVINDDAYMVMMIRSQGYQIRYVPQAVCYLFGPRTLEDYLSQRRRILFGHRQLTRLLGRPPQVLKTMVFHRPWDAIRIFLGGVQRLRSQDLMRVPAVIILEVIASLLALWDSCQKRVERHILWDHISSTKTLVKKEEE